MKVRKRWIVVALVVLTIVFFLWPKPEIRREDLIGSYFALEDHAVPLRLPTGGTCDYNVAHFLRLREDNTFSYHVFADGEIVVQARGTWNVYRTDYGESRLNMDGFRHVFITGGRKMDISDPGVSSFYFVQGRFGKISIPLHPDDGSYLEKQK